LGGGVKAGRLSDNPDQLGSISQNTRWVSKPCEAAKAEALATALRASSAFGRSQSPTTETLARLLVMRRITDPEVAEHYLKPSLSQLHSPYRMLGIESAVARMEAAIERREPILIYGDYDVDGTTAIVILKSAIERCGGSAQFHVPHRIRDGYDLRGDVIEAAAAAGIRLIISVDMGIRAFAAAETARRLGVDLIVTDHHLPGPDGVPAALAVINPNQPGCDYPYKALCGAGVAFKLAQALLERRVEPVDLPRLLFSFMKVVAIATIADAVPLTGENRIFARLGLEGLRSPINPGLKALLEVAQLGTRPITTGEIAFRIAPRINAAGRMDVAREVIELFATRDVARAHEIADHLDCLNRQRQDEERRTLESIETRLVEEPGLRETFCMVIDGQSWHRGVIGITATRVVERYGRPALVISIDGDQAHGSGRSIAGFHLLNALETCASLFTRYGGHAHAVGFSMPAARVPELRQLLDQYARTRLTLADFSPVLEVDEQLSFHQLTAELYQAVQHLEPFGIGNPEPVFSSRNLSLIAPPRLLRDKHIRLKLALAPENEISHAPVTITPRCHPDSAAAPRRVSGWRKSISWDALGWNLAERAAREQLLPGDTLDIAFTLGSNRHSQFESLELSLRDFRVSGRACPGTDNTCPSTLTTSES
jgi:single-stranded-DNA-specific exonuclease